MARAVHNGWDFVKVGKIYQYKEGGIVAMIQILEDRSNEKEYNFKVEVQKSTEMIPRQFEIFHTKEMNGYYNDMLQIYEEEEYWVREYKYDYTRNH